VKGGLDVADQLDGVSIIGVLKVDLVSARLAADHPFEGELISFPMSELAIVLVLTLWVCINNICGGGDGDALCHLLVGIDELRLVYLGAEHLPEEGFGMCDDGGFGYALG
jgi:hypothetical protein